MSKIMCNILIILFLVVCLTVGVIGVVKKADWKVVVVSLTLACAVLLMYQSVIYNGKKQKLLNQIPWENVGTLLKSGNKVEIGHGVTKITPQNKQI